MGTYNVTYARDRERGIDLLAAGFDDLNLSELKQLLDHAENLLNTTSTVQLEPDLLQRWEQARPLLDAISEDQLGNWFTTLHQAIQQGTFDQAYDELLAQGLGQLEDALIILTDDPSAAKEFIRELAQSWGNYRLHQLPEDTQAKIAKIRARVRVRLWLLFFIWERDPTFLLSNLIGLVAIRLCGPAASACEQVVDQLLEALRGKSAREIREIFMDRWNIIIGMLQDDDPELALSFSEALDTITGSFNLGNALEFTSQLIAFMNWVLEWQGAERSKADRFEQMLGSLLVAAHSTARKWQYYGLQANTSGDYSDAYGMWWAGVLYLPPERNYFTGRGVMAVARGDHCTDCAAKTDEIVAWIGRAVELTPSIQQSFENLTDSIAVVTFAFTNPDAQGIDTILQRLQTYAGSQVPIIVSWIDPETGLVRFVCIGAGCSQLTAQEQERIACNQLGRSEGCTNPPPPPEPEPIPFSVSVSSPPPAPSSRCARIGVCIQGIHP